MRAHTHSRAYTHGVSYASFGIIVSTEITNPTKVNVRLTLWENPAKNVGSHDGRHR